MADIDILRCPLAANDDESLVMPSDIQEDAFVRLAYGDPELILASIREDGQRIADFCPQVIQTFSCAARRTLVIVAMREGEPPKDGRKVNIASAQIGRDNNEKIPIIRRFVSFIEASTAELE